MRIRESRVGIKLSRDKPLWHLERIQIHETTKLLYPTLNNVLI
jgi:hypothetical protein